MRERACAALDVWKAQESSAACGVRRAACGARRARPGSWVGYTPCAGLQQHLHGVESAARGGVDERRDAEDILSVWVGVRVEEDLKHVPAATRGN